MDIDFSPVLRPGHAAVLRHEHPLNRVRRKPDGSEVPRFEQRRLEKRKGPGMKSGALWPLVSSSESTKFTTVSVPSGTRHFVNLGQVLEIFGAGDGDFEWPELLLVA